MRLSGYLLRRILELIPAVLFIIVLNFIIIHITPGDPAIMMTIGSGGANAGPGSEEIMLAIRQRFGLDKPVTEQLALYLWNVLHGDLGHSFFRNKPVTAIILEKVPATLFLILTSELIAIIVGTLLGAYSARKVASKTDTLISIVSSTLYSIPVFWSGLMLILVFVIYLGWFPSFGMVSITGTREGIGYVLDALWHLFLPALCLCMAIVPVFVRTTRASVIEVSKEDFILTARAVGLSENAVFFRHALRNALIPVVTTAGQYLGFALSGMVLIETVFSWPGMGRLMFESLMMRDYPIIMGIFIFVSIGVIFIFIIVDVLYAYLDPRIVYK